MFGLASFTSETRTREIGIRKANGASTLDILGTLLSDYLKWPLIACLVTFAAAFILGKIFLGRFHFHSSMPYWAFIAGGVLASAVTLLTVSVQSWRTANRDPGKIFRDE